MHQFSNSSKFISIFSKRIVCTFFGFLYSLFYYITLLYIRMFTQHWV
nr:MAG TPA: hypothetical protein [Bacteriophage sp.]